MSQCGCWSQRGCPLALGLGLRPDIIGSFGCSFSDLMLGNTGMVENRPARPGESSQKELQPCSVQQPHAHPFLFQMDGFLRGSWETDLSSSAAQCETRGHTGSLVG